MFRCMLCACYLHHMFLCIRSASSSYSALAETSSSKRIAVPSRIVRSPKCKHCLLWPIRIFPPGGRRCSTFSMRPSPAIMYVRRRERRRRECVIILWVRVDCYSGAYWGNLCFGVTERTSTWSSDECYVVRATPPNWWVVVYAQPTPNSSVVWTKLHCQSFGLRRRGEGGSSPAELYVLLLCATVGSDRKANSKCNCS